MKLKKLVYLTIHLFFVSGVLYAFFFFVRTPKTNMITRRLWAYESWFILCFYGSFIYLTLKEKSYRRSQVKKRLNQLKEVLVLNIILLVFPWGLFLIFAPKPILDVFELRSVYWRFLGTASLFGALIYSFPYRFSGKKWIKYFLYFISIDNFLAGLVVSWLFYQNQVPLIAFSSVPLLFYFAFFFFNYLRQGHFKLKNKS